LKLRKDYYEFYNLWALTYLLTYLLTYSMVQSPSWEPNWFAASQAIPRISQNPKVHYVIKICARILFWGLMMHLNA